MEDVSQGALGCHRRGGLLQRGGTHAPGSRTLPCAVRHRPQDTTRSHRRRHLPGRREWMAQVARNLTDAAAGPLTGFGHLIVDRDPLYTAHFRTLLQAAGVQLLRLPSRSPNLNAYAERFVRSSQAARTAPSNFITTRSAS